MAVQIDEFLREVDRRRASASDAGRRFFLIPGTPREPTADERAVAAAIEAEEQRDHEAAVKRAWRERTGASGTR